MATIIKKKSNKNEYNYISYSYREGEKVLKKEHYLGKEIPSFEVLIKEWESFSYEIFNERWLQEIDKIAKNYRKVSATMPLAIKAKNVRNFGIRFTHHSTKIEGSPLTLRDVQAIIDNDMLPQKRPIDDVLETKAHMQIYEKMLHTIEELSMDLICEWHKELFQMTDQNIAGVIRDYPVSLTGSKYEPPMYKIEIEMLLDTLFKWYNEMKVKYHPVFLVAIMHYRFVAIHPFGDGNGRITRLLTNYLLYKNNYPMFDIDAKLRLQYYNALNKTDKKKDNELPFILWFAKNYIKTNNKYLKS